jgi:hypothetical protein
MLHIIFMIFYGDILSYFLYRKSFLTMRIKVVPFLGMFVGSCYGGKGFFQRNLWSDSILELCDAFELGSLGSGIWTNPIQTLLVVTGTWLDYDFPFSWECHHPNWLLLIIFFRGVGLNYQAVAIGNHVFWIGNHHGHGKLSNDQWAIYTSSLCEKSPEGSIWPLALLS